MKQVAKIDFFDTSENDNGFALVYADQNQIGLTLSLEHHGDINVFFSSNDGMKLMEALRLAIDISSNEFDG